MFLGFCLRPFHLSPDYIILISYPGELFLRILKLITLPLIISSLIAGTSSINASLNGKIAMRTLIYFLLTSLLNTIIGVTLGTVIHPGDPSVLKKQPTPMPSTRQQSSALDSILDLGRSVENYAITEAKFIFLCFSEIFLLTIYFKQPSNR